MGRNDLRRVQAGQPGHLVEVGTVIHHVDNQVGAALDQFRRVLDGFRCQCSFKPLPGGGLIARPVELDQ